MLLRMFYTRNLQAGIQDGIQQQKLTWGSIVVIQEQESEGSSEVENAEEVWFDGPWFLLWPAYGWLKIWNQQNYSMDQSANRASTVSGGGGGVRNVFLL